MAASTFPDIHGGDTPEGTQKIDKLKTVIDKGRRDGYYITNARYDDPTFFIDDEIRKSVMRGDLEVIRWILSSACPIKHSPQGIKVGFIVSGRLDTPKIAEFFLSLPPEKFTLDQETLNVALQCAAHAYNPEMVDWLAIKATHIRLRPSEKFVDEIIKELGEKGYLGHGDGRAERHKQTIEALKKYLTDKPM